MNTSKIIKGVVSNGRYTVTAPIVKEDYGLYLQIEGVELPSTYEVDFSNSEHSGSSVTMIGNADGVLIPRQFIDSGKDVFAFLYHVGEDFGRTVYKFIIPNKVRPDRTNEKPTPEEQSVIDQAISALNEAVEQTAEDRENADASAQSAYESADEAQQARTGAQNYAIQAEQSAQNAHTYALSADASSGTASDFAEVAQGYASQAQASARTASEKAQNASQSATTAAEKASESAQSAINASQSAQSASQSAQSAQDALEEFTTPTASATTLPEGASATASYTDGNFAFGIPRGDKGDDYILTEQDKEEIADMVEVPSDWLKAFPTDTASGAIASFSDGADNLPLKSLVVNIDPVQDLSQGDPSPDNVRPISGWTGMEIQHDGKNLLPMPIVNGSYAYSTIIAVNDDKSFTITKTIGDGWTPFILGRFMLKQGTYTLIESDDNSYNAQIVLDKVIGDTTEILLTTRNTKRKTFTVEADTLVQARYLRSAVADHVLTKLMLFAGDTATETDYEPYNGNTYSVDWQTEAGTVYGGKLDVLSGVLTVDRAMVDLGTLNWSVTGDRFTVATRLEPNPISRSTWGANDPIAICSNYKYGNIGNGNGVDKAVGFYNGILFARDSTYTDAASFKTAMDGVQLVYELATPITIQLTPHQIRSLYGNNTIFADTGDTSLEYRADPDLYIQRKMPEVPVDDVQINGASIVQGGVADIPIASSTEVGVVRTLSDRGTQMFSNAVVVSPASLSNIKAHSSSFKPITPSSQHASTFYGLAQSAGDTTQSASNNAVGNYTEDAKSAISEMLNGSVSVSGTTPTIVAKSGIRYVCGEVATLDFTPSASGICDVVFTSGSTPTVLTVPSTIKWANGFDPTSLEANTTYEINIMDGLGVTCAWT